MILNQTNQDAGEVNNYGFPLVPFKLLWPIIRLVIGPLFVAIVPRILRAIADKIESNQPFSLSAEEVENLVDQHEQQAFAAYSNGRN